LYNVLPFLTQPTPTLAQVSYTSWFLDAFNYAMLRRIHVINLASRGPDFLDRPFVDKMDVVGVGGIDFDDRVARFSSRGMTTWELPDGYGRLKPDIVTYGAGVRGLRTARETCRPSAAPPWPARGCRSRRPAVQRACCTGGGHQPASIKQALLASARRCRTLTCLAGPRQAGPAASLPAAAGLQASGQPPMYFTGLPVVVNVTILNGMSVAGRIRGEPLWIDGQNGRLLTVSATHSELLWPWSGWLLALQLGVAEAGADFDGVAEGWLNFTVETTSTELSLLCGVRIAPRPPRSRRLLWDQFHSLRYPSGYFPRDNLRVKLDPLDWHGDHPHTNFRDLYGRLSPPATLLRWPSSAAMWPPGLSVLVLADWYNTSVMRRVRFLRREHPAVVGARHRRRQRAGAQRPPWPVRVALGDRVLDGEFRLGDRLVAFSSGCDIAKFPEDGRAGGAKSRLEVRAPVLGFAHAGSQPVRPGTGRIAVLGDSNCADSAHQLATANWLVAAMLHFATAARLPASPTASRLGSLAGGSRLRLHSRVLSFRRADQDRRRQSPPAAPPAAGLPDAVALPPRRRRGSRRFEAAGLPRGQPGAAAEDRVPLPPDRLSAESLESAIRNRQQTRRRHRPRFRLFALSCTLLAAAGLLAFDPPPVVGAD
uniref:SGNH_hydro domain-containing protein n=1 Tax=Macrostomum lignano TaxID=282301 RepID=A0A1I8FGA3_9PLAT